MSTMTFPLETLLEISEAAHQCELAHRQEKEIGTAQKSKALCARAK